MFFGIEGSKIKRDNIISYAIILYKDTEKEGIKYNIMLFTGSCYDHAILNSDGMFFLSCDCDYCVYLQLFNNGVKKGMYQIIIKDFLGGEIRTLENNEIVELYGGMYRWINSSLI